MFFLQVRHALLRGALLATLPLGLLSLTAQLASAEEPPVVRSKSSGPWSAPATWDADRAPKAGDRVLIRADHKVTYDVDSTEVIRLVQIAGTLDFARDRDTKLEVGLVKIVADEDLSEEGFDCHMAPEPPAAGKARPALLVGAADDPIPTSHRALIRLHYIPGMNADSCPAIVCCGGQMDFHGAPLAHSWVKLAQTVESGSSRLTVDEAVKDWKPGDLVIVTSTHRRGSNIFGGGGEGDGRQTEERRIAGPQGRGGFGQGIGGGQLATGPFKGHGSLALDRPLSYQHHAEGNYRGEVANLSRNVVVESANPEGERGHTMYHAHSAGSISYAEFRHLGKRDKLGRYSLHFHQVGDTMRGSSVIGASIWDSDNRWLTIHGTNYLVVRDCVGYKSIGHGYFFEDGSEVYNTLDHNLAVMAMAGKPLPKQMIPYDQNRGAGYWWANSLNAFTHNVAVDCDEYGFRFENRKTADFDPVMTVMQPDGTSKPRDTRILPFVMFSGNEVHSQRFFGLNLRGLSRPAGGLDFYALNDSISAEARDANPEQKHPFWVHDYKCWETEWAFHSGTSGVYLENFDAYRCEYGIWRSVIDRHTYRNISFKEIFNKDMHMPFSVGLPEPDTAASGEYFRGIPGFFDDCPPTTVITFAARHDDNVIVRGTTTDCSAIKSVTVNGQPAYSTSPRTDFAEWETTISAPAGQALTITAKAEDAANNVEARPHEVRLDAVSNQVATHEPVAAK